MGLITLVMYNTGMGFSTNMHHNRHHQSASPTGNQRKFRKNKRRANAAIKNYKF